MSRITHFALAAFAGVVALVASPLDAQTVHQGGIVFRSAGDVVVPAGEERILAVVVGGRLDVQGRVGTAIVVNGEGVFSGAQVDEIIAFNSTVALTDGTMVSANVELVDAELETQDGSQVLGRVQRGARHQVFRGFWVFGSLVAIGYALAMVLGSVIAATVAPHGVRAAGRLIGDEPLKVTVWTLGTWVLLPLGAVFAIPTIIGIPMGLGMFVFVLPTLAFIGYLVTAIRLGDWIIGKLRKSVEQPWPYFAAVTGTVTLLILGLLPVVGGMVPIVAGALGSGAVLLTLARGVGIPSQHVLERNTVT